MAKLSPWVLCCFLAGMAMNVEGATAPAQSPAALDCSTVIFDMMDCLDYVSAGSNVTEPPASCCKGVADVVDVSASCLCEALDMAPTMGVPLNMSRAMGIPDTCSVSIPPGQQCAAESVSPSSPAPMVDSSPTSPVPASPSPSSPPASVAPAQSPSSGASAVVSSSVFLVVGLLAIAC